MNAYINVDLALFVGARLKVISDYRAHFYRVLNEIEYIYLLDVFINKFLL